MATFTPGTTGTLKSVTIEGAFHEALFLAALAEQDSNKNPQNLTRITMTLDMRTGRVTGTFNFALTKSFADDGSTTFPVVEHLVQTGFTKGTGSDLKSSELCRAICELAERLQDKEQISSKNPQALNSITDLNYSSESKLVTGSFDYLVVATPTSDGRYSATAKTYLLD